MRLIGIWALVAATLGPFQNVLGWTISGSLVEGYDPIAKTISDLAANDSPVQWIQSSFFLFGSVYCRGLACQGLFDAGQDSPRCCGSCGLWIHIFRNTITGQLVPATCDIRHYCVRFVLGLAITSNAI